MKNIAMLHYQVGGTDGVSLEMAKWKQVLESLGHQVVLIAGDLGTTDGILVEELYHHRPEIERLSRNTFVELRDYDNVSKYERELETQTQVIYNRLKEIVIDKEIDLFIPNNIWANTCSPPASIAMGRVVRELALPTIAHHHDFYWERIDGVALTCAPAVELADKYMPPRDPRIQHVVINSLGQRELLARKGIRSTVISNVFDFGGPGWEQDDYNADFRQRIGLKEADIMVLQATRIVPKKGIELAVDFVKALNQPDRRERLQGAELYNGQAFNDKSRIVLVLPGITRDDATGQYLKYLKTKIFREGVEALFIEDLIDGYRSQTEGIKRYSLWDTYVYADFVTYPSLWEGWGNQFLEALRARLPVMLFEYPVYRSDIKDNGFKVLSLGSELDGRDDLGLVQVNPLLIENAADAAIDTLTNKGLRDEMTDYNFDLARQNYSLDALSSLLEPQINMVDK